MAKIEDVIVSDRLWRWTSNIPGNRNMRVSPFIIVDLTADGRAKYCYPEDGFERWRLAAEIAAHAEPDPLPEPAKCEPGCTPLEPCASAACPVLGPEYTSVAFYGWSRVHGHGLMAMFDEVKRDKAPPPELRCGRELACGLFRVT